MDQGADHGMGAGLENNAARAAMSSISMHGRVYNIGEKKNRLQRVYNIGEKKTGCRQQCCSSGHVENDISRTQLLGTKARE